MGDINWLSLIIAALIPTALGFVWYNKAVFGKAWMDSIGMTEEKAKSANMPVIMVISLVLAALLASYFIPAVNAPGQEGDFDTFQHGAFHGALTGVLILVPVFITNGLFEQKSWKNMLINVAYWTVALALMAGTIDAMNHWPNVAAS